MRSGPGARRPRHLVAACALAGLLPACAPLALPDPPAPPAAPTTAVYVVRHGWHTHLALRRADVEPAVWPESRDLGEVTWLEVGWGDRDYYPDPQPSLWDALDTVVRPTPAALHVGGFDPEPPDFLPGLPMIRVPLPAGGIERLARFIHDAYERRDGDPVRIRPGTYARSWFYRATGRYHAVCNNSNRWVARGLRAAGIPMTPSLALTAGSVMRQAARFGVPATARRQRGP